MLTVTLTSVDLFVSRLVASSVRRYRFMVSWSNGFWFLKVKLSFDISGTITNALFVLPEINKTREDVSRNSTEKLYNFQKERVRSYNQSMIYCRHIIQYSPIKTHCWCLAFSVFFSKPFVISRETLAGLRSSSKALNWVNLNEALVFSLAVNTLFANWGVVSTTKQDKNCSITSNIQCVIFSF